MDGTSGGILKGTSGRMLEAVLEKSRKYIFGEIVEGFSAGIPKETSRGILEAAWEGSLGGNF